MTMTGQSNNNKYQETDLENAVKAVQNGEMSQRKAAKTFNIPKGPINISNFLF